ncbi:MICOS complex subunit MIC19, partial [Tremellales sp. Uapishka_1]
MGAAQSSQPATEQVISAPEPSTSVQFSPSLLDRLSSPSTPSKPSSSNDDIIRKRLAAESAHLRSEEAAILSSISAALEKENLDKEKPGMSSEVLGRDIEEVREKVERMTRARKEKEGEGVRSSKSSVVKCYLDNPSTPLDCWKEVETFKAEVSKLEQAFVQSLQ